MFTKDDAGKFLLFFLTKAIIASFDKNPACIYGYFSEKMAAQNF